MQMFSSSRKVEPAAPMSAPPPPAPAPAAKPNPIPNGATETSRTGGTRWSGDCTKGMVKFQKGLLSDCEVDGNMDPNGCLTVGKQARIKGEITARTVIGDGTLNDNIAAAHRCVLRAG